MIRDNNRLHDQSPSVQEWLTEMLCCKQCVRRSCVEKGLLFYWIAQANFLFPFRTYCSLTADYFGGHNTEDTVLQCQQNQGAIVAVLFAPESLYTHSLSESYFFFPYPATYLRTPVKHALIGPTGDKWFTHLVFRDDFLLLFRTKLWQSAKD